MRIGLILPVAFAAALAGCGQGPAVSLSPQREAELLASSRAIATSFQAELQAALKAAMASGGPVGAIDTCATVAPAIADRLSAEHGAVVRRTANRARNPAAKPDAFERETMRAWAASPVTPDGKPAERFQLVRGDDNAVSFRYMRAIPMGAPCATCHGALIAPEVERAIAARYPADRATGFRQGELRGAFSIRWPIAQK